MVCVRSRADGVIVISYIRSRGAIHDVASYPGFPLVTEISLDRHHWYYRITAPMLESEGGTSSAAGRPAGQGARAPALGHGAFFDVAYQPYAEYRPIQSWDVHAWFERLAKGERPAPLSPPRPRT